MPHRVNPRLPALLGALLAPAAFAFAAPAAAPASGPVLVELFTSQGCSSCPPAEALFAELASRRPNVLALSLHVTYWDRLGWKDSFSLPEATERQRGYAARLGLPEVYTPQLVAGGRHQAVGSNPADVRAAIAAASAESSHGAVPLRLSADGAGLRAELGAGEGAASLVLVGFDARHVTPVGRGENAGRLLTEVNVVRSLRMVATWNGAPLSLILPFPAGERVALLLQAADGRILGAATLPRD